MSDQVGLSVAAIRTAAPSFQPRIGIVLGSGLAATAPDIGTLIAARALQGAGFGVISLGMSIIRDVLPPARVGILTMSSVPLSGAAAAFIELIGKGSVL